MARLRLFGRAAQAAGTAQDDFSADTVADLLAKATSRYGNEFGRVAATCKIWVNGGESKPSDALVPDDEVALLPPVSGG